MTEQTSSPPTMQTVAMCDVCGRGYCWIAYPEKMPHCADGRCGGRIRMLVVAEDHQDDHAFERAARLQRMRDGGYVVSDYEQQGWALQTRCMDCQLAYGAFPLDMTLPDEQWRMIHNSEGGLLCAGCIVKRAARLPGIVAVRARFEFAPDLVSPSRAEDRHTQEEGSRVGEGQPRRIGRTGSTASPAGGV